MVSGDDGKGLRWIRTCFRAYVGGKMGAMCIHSCGLVTAMIGISIILVR